MVRNLLAAACVVMVSGLGFAAELTSGPQVGEKLAGPFQPLNINGSSAGEKHCLYCENGSNPVVMIFARNPECPQTIKLIKEVDATVAKNEGCKMGAFVVFCTDDSTAETKIKALCEKEKFKKIVLSIDSPAGPKGYKVAKDADVTVVLYTDRTVKANCAHKAGELKDESIQKVIKDVAKIAPEAK